MIATLGGARRRAGLPTQPERCLAGPPMRPGWCRAGQAGVLSLEAVLILPVLAVLLVVLLQLAALVADVLLLHEAARAGARAAATTSGRAAVAQAAREAAPELDGLRVAVEPETRRDGDLAHVTVTVHRTVGPVSHRLRATAVARVEPAVGTTARQEPP